MILKLLSSSKRVPDTNLAGIRLPILQKCNWGFPLAMYDLWLLKQNGIHCQLIDTAYLSQDTLKATYDTAIPLAIAKKYNIRRVFGTKHQSGTRFGVDVPALFVYTDRRILKDIYPHIENKDEYVRIVDFLGGLLLDTDVKNVKSVSIRRPRVPPRARKTKYSD